MVLADNSVEYGGYTVNYLLVREVSRALKLYFVKQGPSCYYITLDNLYTKGLDVAWSSMTVGNEVNSWFLHGGNNQLFQVNTDNSISPCYAP